MTDRTVTLPASRILDPQGHPARAPADRQCPRCGADPEARVASGGFGAPHPVCSRCGYEFHGESWP